MSSVPVRFFTYKLGNSKKLTGPKRRQFLQEGALDRNIFVRLTLREFEREREPPMLLRTALSFFWIMQSLIYCMEQHSYRWNEEEVEYVLLGLDCAEVASFMLDLNIIKFNF